MEFATKMKLCMVWIGLGALLIYLWVIGKMTGFINTPLIVTMAPYITGATTFVGILVSTGMVLHKIGSLGKDVARLEQEFHEFRREVKEDLRELRTDLKGIDKRLYAVEGKLLMVETRLTSVEASLTSSNSQS